jgi:phosphotransferase system enzyme I (PtsI)
MSDRRQVLRGIAAAPGVAVGRVCLFERGHLYVPRRYIARDGIDAEAGRLHEAVEASRRELEELRMGLSGAEQRLLLDAQLLMHRDELLIDGAVELLRERCINAEWALSQATSHIADKMRGASDAYLRERAIDVEHVGERILRKLTGAASPWPELGEDGVVVADDLGPADAAQILKNSARGIAIDLGSTTSHTAILARALDIPAVVGLRGLSRLVADDDLILVDGFQGQVVLFPTEEEEQRARERGERFRAFTRSLRASPSRGVQTKDGGAIVLHANVELPAETALAVQEGAGGIGLYRTEFLYLDREEPPSEEEQAKIYRDVAQVMAPDPVVFRTFDIGGDKLHARAATPAPLNPALGLRGLRLGLEQPELLQTQLRAMLRASEQGNVQIMFPLVSSVEELRAGRVLLDEARESLRREGAPVSPVKVGAMIEVPAAVMMADELARECDFFSVGTNDLVQYTLAVDRGNPGVAHLASPLHPAVLRLLSRTAEVAHAAGIELNMCGGMAADPVALPLVIGLGFKRLSVDLAYLPIVRAAIRAIDPALAAALARDALACATTSEVRALVIERFRDSLSELWTEQGVEL